MVKHSPGVGQSGPATRARRTHLKPDAGANGPLWPTPGECLTMHRHRQPRRQRVTIVVALLAALLAACGGTPTASESEEGATGAEATGAAATGAEATDAEATGADEAEADGAEAGEAGADGSGAA